jgi:hypothetical protein
MRYFIIKFRQSIYLENNFKSINDLSYMANQITGKGGCGLFNKDDHKDYQLTINNLESK